MRPGRRGEDLVDPGVDGFLYDPEDDDALRDAVGALVDRPGLRERMGEAGRRRVLGRTWETLCEELLDRYRDVIAHRALELAR